MRFLVLGGAGYVGSHFVKYATQKGHSCVVFDNLSRGHAWAVPAAVDLVKDDIKNTQALQTVLAGSSFDAVLHFAAFALVGESVSDPISYYQNNVAGVLSLIQAIHQSKQRVPIVFSSSCAVFGVPQRLPMAEDDPKCPASPYGYSKLFAEQVLCDSSKAYQIKVCALRYFNAAGADLDSSIGEAHEPETHLIPNVIKAALTATPVQIMGNDYPTRDGTCVRDYIHVTDLAAAHILAAERLQKEKSCLFDAYHLGVGKGYSNLQVVQEVEKVSGRKIKVDFVARRPGDPPELYAAVNKAHGILGFRPQFSDLHTIVKSAWDWHQKRV